MIDRHDVLDTLAPMLRVWPELQDFCRFGGSWRVVHPREGKGWAAFHIVTHGSCFIERTGEQQVRLKAGDVLLLPHGDDHVVYGESGGQNEFREIATTYRNHLRINRTPENDADTEFICGRLHLETGDENLLLRTLPRAILFRLGGQQECAMLVVCCAAN